MTEKSFIQIVDNDTCFMGDELLEFNELYRLAQLKGSASLVHCICVRIGYLRVIMHLTRDKNKQPNAMEQTLITAKIKELYKWLYGGIN